MRSTIRIEQAFRGADAGVTVRRYAAHAPLAPPRKGEECVRRADLDRAERALVYAAVSDGMASPSVIRTARATLGMDVDTFARQMSTTPTIALAWEHGTTPMLPDEVADLAVLLEQSDRGGMVATRV